MSAPFNFYESQMRQADNRYQLDQGRALAEQGASRLEALGTPEAQQWAQRLRQDPHTALAMAKEYGGFAQIEQQIRTSKAAGQSARAMDPLDLEILRSEGTEGMFRQAGARKADAEVKQLESLSGMSRDQLLDHYTRFDPPKAKVLAEMWGEAGLSEEDVRHLAGKRSDVTKTFDTLFRAVRAANTADVNSPEWGQALTILMNQVLQPNSAVLEGEAKATAAALQSALEQAGAMVEGTFNPQSPLGPEGRKRVMSIINDLARTAHSDYSERHDSWKSMNADMKIQGAKDLFSRPGYEMLDSLDKLITSLPTTKGKPADDAVGARRTITDPDTGKPVVYQKAADGNWDPVDE